MPNNEKNNEDLIKRQAEFTRQIGDMLAELDAKSKENSEESRKNDADRIKNAEERARIEGDARLLEARTSSLDADELQLAEKHKLLQEQAGQLSDQKQELAQAKAQIDAEMADLLPKMRAVIEAGELALTRESKNLDVMDRWEKSMDRIAVDMSGIVQDGAETKKSVAEITTSMTAGFEAVGFVKNQVSDMFKSLHESSEFLKNGQATIINGMRDGFDHVNDRVARVLQVSQRTIKFVMDLRAKAYESQEKMASLEVAVADINKQTLKIVKAHHGVLMGSLESLHALPGKINDQVKNLNTQIAKIRGEADGVVKKFHGFADGLSERAQDFHAEVDSIRELHARHDRRLDRELTEQIGKYQETLEEGARQVIGSYDKIMKESDAYDFISKVHLYKEQLDHTLAAAVQLLREIQSEELEFSSEIKKTGSAVKEDLRMAKDGIGGSIREIDGTVDELKNRVSTATAEVSGLCTQIIELKAHLVRVAGEAQNLTAMATNQASWIGDKYLERFEQIFTNGLDAFVDKAADRFVERSFERDLEDLGGDVPE
jgi:chromosome segregation ATPase